jgi:hypothetical protein
MRRLFQFVVLLAAAGATSCDRETPFGPDGKVCTAQYVFGLAVTVQAKASGQRICDAEVVASAGSYQETLRSFGPSDSCTYAGAGERPDVYEIRATRAGFSPATLSGGRVGADECHVIPVKVTIELLP